MTEEWRTYIDSVLLYNTYCQIHAEDEGFDIDFIVPMSVMSYGGFVCVAGDIDGTEVSSADIFVPELKGK